MDILTTLRTQGENLYPEDLEFFEVELAVGEYDEVYVHNCRKEIESIRIEHTQKDFANKSKKPAEDETKPKHSVLIELDKLTPQGVASPADLMTDSERMIQEIRQIRKIQETHIEDFRNYVKSQPLLTEEFIDANFTFFDKAEMDVIITEKQLSEKFIEKYFSALNLKTVAQHQQYSEQFFMKHFSKLDVGIVLANSKNTWHKKENRSKELDVFLRLKGVEA
jgi:hypothetical protein